MDTERLSSLIYETAVVPELWPTLLESAASHVDAFAGTLFTVGREHSFNLMTESFASIWKDVVAEGWDKVNPRPERAIKSGRTRFLHDAQIFSQEEMATHRFYTEFCQRWNLGGSLGTRIAMPGGGSLFFTLERHRERGPYTDADVAKLNRLWPDLSRSVELTSRLLFQQYLTTTSILNAVGIASAVITPKRKLLNCNELFSQLMPGMIQDRSFGLTLTSKSANTLLEAAFARIAPGNWVGVTASIPIPAAAGVHPAGIVHILPIRGIAHDIVHGGAALIIVSIISGNTSPADAVLQALFDLTAAESRVASSLIRNLGNYNEVASDLGVTKETVRTHSKTIYQKTGMTGAVELISLVGSIKVHER